MTKEQRENLTYWLELGAMGIVIILMILSPLNVIEGYYTHMRYVVSSIFAYFSFRHFKAQNGCLGYLCAAGALVFEPFRHLSLGWVIWDIVDGIVIIIMLSMIYRSVIEQKDK